MRVIVLAFDALESSLVEKMGLTGLLQETHGSYVVPEEYYNHGVPYTPTVWLSIVSGLRPAEHGVKDWFTYRSRTVEQLRHKPPFTWIKGKRRLLRYLGIRRVVVSNRETKVPTIFEREECQPSVPLFIPAYNSPTSYHDELAEATRRGTNELIRTVWRLHRRKEEELFKQLGNEWKLLMEWFDIADLLGHACWVTRPGEVMYAYQELDALAKEVRRRVGGDAVVIVLSDHGMEASSDGVTGNHSDHAYWSVNRKINWSPAEPTFFAPKIIELCKEEA